MLGHGSTPARRLRRESSGSSASSASSASTASTASTSSHYNSCSSNLSLTACSGSSRLTLRQRVGRAVHALASSVYTYMPMRTPRLPRPPRRRSSSCGAPAQQQSPVSLQAHASTAAAGAAASAAHSPEHLIVLANGLFGHPQNWTVITAQLQQRLPPGKVLIHASQANVYVQTYGARACIVLARTHPS